MIDHAQLRNAQRRGRALSQTIVKEVPIYDEGSFVPTLVGSGVAGTFTYVANVNLVEWTRIGNRLFFNGRLQISAIAVAPTLNMSIQGWPFPGVADSNMAIAGGASMFFWQANIVAGYTQVAGQFANGSSIMAIHEMGDNVGTATMQGGEIIATSQFRFQGIYRVA